MFDNTKYIIVERNGNEIPVLFSASINHCDMRVGKVVSAGFCQVFTGTGAKDVSVCCFGKSESLNIEARREDKEIIERELNRWKKDF